MSTVIKKFGPRGTTGVNAYAEFDFLITDCADYETAKNDLRTWSLDNIGETFLAMPIRDVKIEPDGMNWIGMVRYDLLRASLPNTGDVVYEFDTTGGTIHVTQAKQHIAKYPAGAPECFGAINQTTDGVDGVDLHAPVFAFKETHYKPASEVTDDYKAAIFLATATTNAQPFKGFETGSVLFLGAQGSQRGGSDYEITFYFAASPNATGLSFAGFTGINKNGWEYMWTKYERVQDGEHYVQKPLGVYIERVFDPSDFAALEIGT